MPSFRVALAQGLIAIALVLACLIAATQWAAAMLAYQAALGAPWIDLLGCKVYAPWKLGIHPIENVVVQPWVRNFKRNQNILAPWKYLDLNVSVGRGR